MFGSKKDKSSINQVNQLNEDISRLFVAQNIIQLISHKNSFEEIAIEILNQIEKKMNYTGASISVVDTDKDTIELKYTSDSFVSTLSKKLNILDKNSFLPLKLSTEPITLTKKAVLENRIIIDKDLYKFTVPPMSMEKAKMIQSISMTKCMVALPIRAQGKVIAVLNFTLKKDPEEIHENEMKTLELFVDQIGLIIDNATKYQEIKSFNVQLENNVQIATDSLRIQYEDLSSLYNLTSLISHTLDPEKVAQIAVNSLPQRNGLLGAILTSFDEKSGNIIFWTLTRNNISNAVEKVLGNFSEYKINIANENLKDNIMVKTILEKKPYFIENIEDAYSPPIPATIVPVIKKILDLKYVAIYPIFSRNKVYGTITYLIQNKKLSDITKEEKQLYETYSYQISIALENSTLYKESKKIQQNLEQALQQVQLARKHEQDMIDILGHELRTPATICKGNIELLQSYTKNIEIPEQDKVKINSKLKSAYSAIIQEANLISELLSAAKLDSGQLVISNEEVNVMDLAQAVYQNYVDIAEKKGLKLEFINKCDNSILTVGDNIRIEEVLDNLTSNAIKYTNKGTVTMIIDHDDKYIYAHIKDSGNGVPKEEIPQLFKKFHRLNNYISTSDNKLVRPGGTGLGLYVAKGIIQAHGGTIWVDSEGEGKGSTFSFSIPIKELNKEEKDANDTQDMFKKLGLK
ncbi:MAG: ATP-binding protein [bacterium]